MRPRAATQTIVAAPALVPSSRVRRPEPSDDESNSESTSDEDAGHKYESIKEKSDIQVDRESGEILVDGGQIGDSEMERGDSMAGGDVTSGVGYDMMGHGVGDGDMGGDMGGDGDGDSGMGYEKDIDSGEAHLPGSPLVSHGSHSARWPGDSGYDQHMSEPFAMDQDDDAAGAFWKSQHGTARYRTAADKELLSAHLQVPGVGRRGDHHMIPLDTDAIVNHYDTPRKPKRGRGQSDVESRESKVNRQSASHSSAGIQSTMVSTGAQSPSSAIPSTKVSTRQQSPSHSVSPVGLDFQGASRSTGGVFRGRALGNNPNWADSMDRNANSVLSKPTGKVLLYTSRDQEAHPAMMITHEIVAQLPPILEKLSRKFSPIRSK
jgi:hypothetical protein